MQKLEFNASIFNMKEAQKKLELDSDLLDQNECLFFINECEFDVVANSDLTIFKAVDIQYANLGDIENEEFNSLNDVVNRLSDTYLVDYGFICRDN